MGTLEIFIENVRRFYLNLEDHVNKFEKLVENSVKPCSAISNQSLILVASLKSDSLLGTGLEGLPKFKILLNHSILNSMNKELKVLIDIREEINSLNNILLEQYKSVEKSFLNLGKEDLLDNSQLNPASPRFEYIIDWSLDAWRYYHSLGLQISQAVENLRFENEESVNSLATAFKEDINLKGIIQKIRRFELDKFEFML